MSQEQKTKLPNISLSNHDKPQTIALMTRRHVMDHGVFISGKAINTTNFLDNPSYTGNHGYPITSLEEVF